MYAKLRCTSIHERPTNTPDGAATVYDVRFVLAKNAEARGPFLSGANGTLTLAVSDPAAFTVGQTYLMNIDVHLEAVGHHHSLQ